MLVLVVKSMRFAYQNFCAHPWQSWRYFMHRFSKILSKLFFDFYHSKMHFLLVKVTSIFVPQLGGIFNFLNNLNFFHRFATCGFGFEYFQIQTDESEEIIKDLD